MVGIVVVSHSRRLADAAVELALQMVRGTPPPIEVAAGLDNHVLGTDAARVKEAIDRVASPDGVIVMMDLGSAVLERGAGPRVARRRRRLPHRSLRRPDRRRLRRRGSTCRCRRAAGRGRRGRRAGRTHQDQAARHRDSRRPRPGRGTGPVATIELTLHNDHGLHARPAARFVETVRRFEADVTVRNLSTGGPAVSGRSVSALSTLGVPNGDQIEVSASGRHAREALAAIAALVRRNFDEPMTAVCAVRETNGAGPSPASPGIGIGPKCSLPDMSVVRTEHRARLDRGGDRTATRRLRSSPDRAQLDPRPRGSRRRSPRGRDLRRPLAPPR